MMYSLVRAFQIVKHVDSSAGRVAVFDQVAGKNWLIGMCFRTYEKMGPSVKAILLAMYGLKCFLSLKNEAQAESTIIYFASYPNEHDAINHVRARLGHLPSGRISISRGNCVRLSSLLALPIFLRRLPQLVRIGKTLSRRFHFLPACRLIGTISYFMRGREMLSRGGAKALFIANHYSPECLALAAATHGAGRKVLFTNHANSTADGPFAIPIHSDLAAVSSQAVLDVYQRHTQHKINAVFLPQAVPQKPMTARIDGAAFPIVGVFLTALTNTARLYELVDRILARFPDAKILIRQHPALAVNENLSGLVRKEALIAETTNIPLAENIGQCDIAVCGESTVTIEILRGGVPVLYDEHLDRISFDYNGFLRHDIVLPIPRDLDEDVLKTVELFFGSSRWKDAFRYFDASYGRNEDEMYRAFVDRVGQICR